MTFGINQTLYLSGLELSDASAHIPIHKEKGRDLNNNNIKINKNKTTVENNTFISKSLYSTYSFIKRPRNK